MKLRHLAGAFALFLACMAPAFAQQQVYTNAGDVTNILGSSPLFPTGIKTDQYGNWSKLILDSTPSTPAAAGAVVVYSGTTWAQSTVAGAALPPGEYGVVVGSGGNATIIVRGKASALCTTAAVAIAAGTQLVADGSGNLTVPAPLAAPSSGTATPQGTTGAATVTYQLYARSAYALDSVASANVTTASANATLTPANSVSVVATLPAGTTQVVVVRTAGGAAQGVLGVVPILPGQLKLNYLDYGQTPGGATYTPNAVPTYPNGTVLAVALGALTTSSSATSVPVFVGGY